MPSQLTYGSYWTAAGLARKANMNVGGPGINFTTIVLGDGNGQYVTNIASNAALINEVWRSPIKTIGQAIKDPNNDNQVIISITIPGAVGGWTIREFILLDENGLGLVIGNCPDTLKSNTANGDPTPLPFRITLAEANPASVGVVDDPTMVYASDKDLVDALANHQKANDPHSQYELKTSLAADVAAIMKTTIDQLTQLTDSLQNAVNGVSETAGQNASDIQQLKTTVSGLTDHVNQILNGASASFDSFLEVQGVINQLSNQISQINQTIAGLSGGGSNGNGGSTTTVDGWTVVSSLPKPGSLGRIRVLSTNRQAYFDTGVVWKAVQLGGAYVFPNSDVYQKLIVLQLSFDGTNGQTTFTDDSGGNKPITTVGASRCSTTWSYSGDTSLRLSGNSDMLVVPYSPDFHLAGDATIEMVVNPDALADYQRLVVFNDGYSINANYEWSLLLDQGKPRFDWFSGNTQYTAYGPANCVAGTGNHVAVTLEASLATVWLNGQPGTPVAYSGANSLTDASLHIGQDGNGQVPFVGYIDDLRITNGYARYTQPFVPPIPYWGNDPYLSYNALLLHFSGSAGSSTLTDSTIYNHTPSAGTRVAISNTQGFVDGVSGDFTSGDGLTYATQPEFVIGLNDFTMEAEVFPTQDMTGRFLYKRYYYDAAGGTWCWNVSKTQMSFTQVIAGEPGPQSVNNPSIVFNISNNAWTHIACTRRNGKMYFSVAGKTWYAGDFTTNINDSTYPLYVGTGPSNPGFVGYMKDLRFKNGVGLYTKDFTPPTLLLPDFQSLTSYRLAVLASGPLDYWKFDGGFQSETTKANAWLTLDAQGGKDTFDVPLAQGAGSGSLMAGGSYTYTAPWDIRYNNTVIAFEFLIKCGVMNDSLLFNINGDAGVALHIGSNHGGIWLTVGGQLALVPQVNTLTDNKVHHVVVQYSQASGGSITIDDQSLTLATNQLGLTPNYANQSMMLFGGASPFVGDLDEFAVYPRLLNTSEIDKHYQLTKTGS